MKNSIRSLILKIDNMKKLTFGTGHSVIVEKAICNYCGFSRDMCFKTVNPAYIMMPIFDEGKNYNIIDDWNYNIFFQKVIKGLTQSNFLYKKTGREVLVRDTYICSECVQEINEFIQQEDKK